MICPNCKSIMEEGKLYCEKCGAEIKIVPDFEPLLENEIHDTLSGMVNDFNNSQAESEELIDRDVSSFMEDEKVVSNFIFRFLKTKFIYILLVICLLVAGIAGSWFYSMKVHKSSFEYQYGQALIYANEGKYNQAIMYMENAVKLKPEEHQAQLALAKYYISMAKNEKAIEMLKELITYSDVETNAYTCLINLYGSQKKYDTISHLLLNCTNKEILKTFENYIAYNPDFSYAEGTYQEVVALKLTSDIKGTIYYSMDGTTPTKESEIYSTPLFLENGVYRISAFFVNEYGIESEVVTKTYTIDTTVPYAPEVKLYSGTYNKPELISVDIPENCDVFYTIDGTEPTAESIQYTEPFPMYLGKVTLKFIAVNFQGVSSDVTERSYELDMNGEITKENAVNNLVMALTDKGYLLDYNGYVAGLEGRNAYLITAGITIESNDYYLIWEYYEDVNGTMTKTGKIYAVDIHTGDFFDLTVDASGNYNITPLL